MKTFAFLILSSIALASCTNDNVTRGGLGLNPIFYMKDIRTNLCFATSGGGNTTTLTIVPCTVEVLKAIEQDSKL